MSNAAPRLVPQQSKYDPELIARNEASQNLANSSRMRLVVYAMFFVSGLTALMYEVAWLNRIQLVMGHTVYSLATTLSAYLSGLALGAVLAARLVRSRLNALMLYVLAEAAIGVYGLGFTGLVEVVQVPYGWIVTNAQLPLVALSLVQFVFCGVLVLLPTTLMGMTLPLLMKALAASDAQSGNELSNLYTVNTLGAFVGSLFCGFLALPLLGYTRTVYLAAGMNIAILMSAVLLIRNFEVPSPKVLWRELSEALLGHSVSGARMAETPAARAALGALFISGFASMIVQIGWGRLASLVFGPSAYIFPLVTAVVLAGIAVGTICMRHVLRESGRAQTALMVLPVVAAVTLAFTNFAITRVPNAMLWLHQAWPWGEVPFWPLKAFELCILLAACTPSAMMLGAIFPVASAVLMQSQGRGEGEKEAALARGYALNIFGFITGGVAGSFVLMPVIGLESMLGLLCGALLLMSIVFAVGLARNAVLAVSMASLGFVVAKVVPAYDWTLLTSGHFYNRTPKVKEQDLEKIGYKTVADYTRAYETRLLARKDDPHATISIHQGLRNPRDRAFKINGKVDGNNTSDLTTTRFVALLPSLLSRRVDKVLTIGLGTGSTVAETLRYAGLKQSTVIELSAAMIEFSKAHFSEINRAVWSDPRVRVINRDGRDFLDHTRETFDLILSEPSNPWVDGVGSLFTQEYYESISKRLNPEGVAALWFHSYGLDCTAVQSVVAAASHAFASLYVFKLGGDLYMLASNNPAARLHPVANEHFMVEYDLLNIAETGKASRKEAYEAFFNKTFLFTKIGAARFTAHAAVNRDDNQILQFSSGKTYYQRISCDNYLPFSTRAELEMVTSQVTSHFP